MHICDAKHNYHVMRYSHKKVVSKNVIKIHNKPSSQRAALKIHVDIISNDWFWRMRFVFIKTHTDGENKNFFSFLCEFYSKMHFRSLFI
jgi:hypothetical protein